MCLCIFSKKGGYCFGEQNEFHNIDHLSLPLDLFFFFSPPTETENSLAGRIKRNLFIVCVCELVLGLLCVKSNQQSGMYAGGVEARLSCVVLFYFYILVRVGVNEGGAVCVMF